MHGQHQRVVVYVVSIQRVGVDVSVSIGIIDACKLCNAMCVENV